MAALVRNRTTPAAVPENPGSAAPSYTCTLPPWSAAGDGVADDTSALQRCLDAAGAVGATARLPAGRYKTTEPLLVPAGVTVAGEGPGSNPLNSVPSDSDGTDLRYHGAEAAVVITGHLSALRDIKISDRSPGHIAAFGVLINATGTLLESVYVTNVLLYWFSGGTALDVRARAGGGVAYSHFTDIRIRHGKIGISLTADSPESFSFVNSNTFEGGAISGGGFDYGILVDGPGSVNNNVIRDIVVEPYTSTYGHLVVRGSRCYVECYACRFEAKDHEKQHPGVGIIQIAPESYGNVIEGLSAWHWRHTTLAPRPRPRHARAHPTQAAPTQAAPTRSRLRPLCGPLGAA